MIFVVQYSQGMVEIWKSEEAAKYSVEVSNCEGNKIETPVSVKKGCLAKKLVTHVTPILFLYVLQLQPY